VLALSKPRVTSLVWVSTLAGMVIAGGAPASVYVHALIGSWLVIAAANALNQVLEVGADSVMKRTRSRPLPAGRLSLGEGFAIGMAWAVLGLVELALFVNPLTAALGAASIALYVLAYTPLKPRSHLATAIGAIPGAIPPLAGWVAATGTIGPEALLLFAVQFFWQFPHFWSIAWLLREDYAAAGFKMLPLPDADARATGIATMQFSGVLLPLSLYLFIYMSRQGPYAVGAVLLSVWVISAAYRFWRAQDDASARKLLKVTVMYLPLWLLLVVLTK
jgi:protoheme IX farnesyltransferase